MKINKKVIAGIVVAMVVLIMICQGGNSDSDVSDDENSEIAVLDSHNTDETEDNADYKDGVSADYKDVSGMVDTDRIINDYHENGYTYVWLESHEVEAPDDGKAGDYGTKDTVQLKATYVNENGLYYFTEEITAIYAYWGDSIGWKNTYDAGELIECDATGFNNTYWKMLDDGADQLSLYDEAISSFFDEDALGINEEISSVSIYFAFENFDILEATNLMNDATESAEVKLTAEYGNQVGTVLCVINGTAYSAPLSFKSYTGGTQYGSYLDIDGDGCSAKFLFDNKSGTGYVEIYCDSRITTASDLEKVFSSNYITPVTEDEYLSAQEGSVVTNSGSEESADNSTDSDILDGETEYEVTVTNIYGTYEYDNGAAEPATAEVYFSTGEEDGGDWIYIETLIDEDRKYTEFSGYMEWLYGDTYMAESIYNDNCTLTIVFEEDGMSVTVSSDNSDSDYYYFDGYYYKTSELDVSTVG